MPHAGNWCNPTTRWAIYLRDGLACVYCGTPGELTGLTLDHVHGRAAGNAPDNLVTACNACNASRGGVATSASFYRRLAELQRCKVATIRSRVDAQRAVPLTLHGRRAAAELLRRRPPWVEQILALSHPHTRAAMVCASCAELCPWCDPTLLDAAPQTRSGPLLG